jgi:hypothetical protein
MPDDDAPSTALMLLRQLGVTVDRVAAKVELLDDTLRGRDGSNGLVAKVNAMWAERPKTLPADHETGKIRWRAIGEIALALGTSASLILHYLGG